MHIYEQLKNKSVVKSGENTAPGAATKMTGYDRKVNPLEGATALLDLIKKR